MEPLTLTSGGSPKVTGLAWKLVTAATWVWPRWRDSELSTAMSGTLVVVQGAGLGGTEGAGPAGGVASRRHVTVSSDVVGGVKVTGVTSRRSCRPRGV